MRKRLRHAETPDLSADDEAIAGAVLDALGAQWATESTGTDDDTGEDVDEDADDETG